MADVLRESVEVDCDPAAAFDAFVESFGAWWPRSGAYRISGQAGTDVVVEAGVGGRMYELLPDGTEIPWGAVLVAAPPRALSLSWYPGASEERPARVDVRFRGVPGEGPTKVSLEHRGPDEVGAELWEEGYEMWSEHWVVALRCLALYAAQTRF